VEFGTPQFWLAGLEIIVINILLSGDNAVVIALACRNLPDKQRRWGIFWGAFGAIALRIVLTIFALSLLTLPWLKIIGAVLLLWIGVKLIADESGEGGHEIQHCVITGLPNLGEQRLDSPNGVLPWPLVQ